MNEKKLMIIDDEKSITDLIEKVAKCLELEILSINDSALIGNSYKKFKPDTIFLDLGLPGFEGADILSFLADLGVTAKIFLISGLDRMSLESCQAIGVGHDLNIVGALTKPFSRDDILYALSV